MKSEITLRSLSKKWLRVLAIHCDIWRLRFKSFVIDKSAGALNWIGDHIRTDDKEVRWQDHLRWFLERPIERVLCWAMDGSNEELALVLNGQIPLNVMCPRMRSVLPPDLTIRTVHCVHCGWEGPHFATINEICPNRHCRCDVYFDFSAPPSNQKLLTA